MKPFKITPEYLTNYVNFHFTDEKWTYQKDEGLNIAKLQAEGAAKIYNLLLDEKVALLADEVGMGKTYEALAVMVSLWRQKPDAKILLYAPNEIVAFKWITDYNNFIRKNYKENDDLVKSSLNEEPLHKAVYCQNHIELIKQISKKWVSFYVCKTSSLSGFLSPKMNNDVFSSLGLDVKLEINPDSTEEEKAQWMYKLASVFNNFTYEKLSKGNNPPFDLLVYDEAHYLRRTEPSATSNRSIVAHAFFAGRNIKATNPYQDFHPIASKILLMTATPTHSSDEDVKTVVSLFNSKYKDETPEKILRGICVRRFRRLENKIKYEYRDEIPEGVKMKSLQEKLFFAAYQKSLVLQKAKAFREGKVNTNNPYRVLFGYLEGFEFISNDGEKSQVSDTQNKDNTGSDFENSEDTTVIKALSKRYFKAYRTNPAHPKYQQIISDLLPPTENNGLIEKKLVFVRRIPSVNEISSRIVAEYDKRFKQEFKQIIGAKRINKVNLRKFFYNVSKGEALEDESTDTSERTENNIYDIPKSNVLDLFTVKKEGKYKTTDCSNFRLRFLKDEQIFSVFFQPSLDYKQSKYTISGFITKAQNDKARRLYQTTIKTYRKSEIKKYSTKLEIGIKHEQNQLSSYEGEPFILDTLMGIWLRSECTHVDCKEAKEEYNKFTILEKEGFSNYLEAGILFSSQYIINFYTYYHKYRHLKGRELYIKFCEIVERQLEKIGLSVLILKAVLTFRQFYKKELGLTEKKLLIGKNWNFLKSTIPVYPYNGMTKRPSIVRAFNTPFFPNALIATSVLQEGVDLHYHCSSVIHYGIAWTPGDNEQRNGRVDRLFGKLHNDLKADSNSKFPIRYPYLENTLDEYQLQRFIKRKYSSEKLLDRLKTTTFSKEVNLQERVKNNWFEYFNKPETQKDINEPFAVKYSYFDDVRSIPTQKNITKTFKLKDALETVFNTVRKIYGDEVLYYQFQNNNKAEPLLCAIKHIRHNGRHQPILIEIKYFEPGISWINRPTYLIKIKTPLCGSNKCFARLELDDSLRKIYQDNPILKINYVPYSKGYFQLYISTELPVFIVNNDSINLSSDELITAIKNVISFADNLESSLFSGESDIKNRDIIKPTTTQQNNNGSAGEKILGEDRPPEKEILDWEINSTNQYFFKSRIADNDDEGQSIYEYNDQNNLIRKIRVNQNTFYQVGLYKSDALPEELELIKKIMGNAL